MENKHSPICFSATYSKPLFMIIIFKGKANKWDLPFAKKFLFHINITNEGSIL